MNRNLIGRKRSDFETAKIGILALPLVEYGTLGYADALNFYNPDKADFILTRFREKLGENYGPLAEIIKVSDARMESEAAQ